MKKWQKVWPFLLAFVVWFLNTDWVVIPSLHKRALCIWGVSLYDLSWLIPALTLKQIFVIICIVSTLELIFWFYFLVWFRDLVLRTFYKKPLVKETIELGKEIKTVAAPVLEETGLKDRILEISHRWLHWSISDTNPVVAKLKRLGYWGLFSFSSIPETGTRVAAIFICSMSKSKKGMLCVLAGNLVKNSMMVFAWGLVSRMQPIHQLILLSVVFLALLIVILKKSKET
ncbi:MAG: hypothetical protein A3B99_02495 [Candidatus Yanofskybacteria bacterium RIFCSPHIGHO2_02_FULL_44_12b]|uniref:Uncharacterized protein n=2 Tax=Candidatus Yanofskyibacteriota TaxID=1752733 RepID=A0A1F8GKU8_9BACT|nr:MAG: hypothetical protein UW79_C0029G0004 [Candidatus Yanofskybacteria bacterium GW2011_GWA2_44_9]OGN04006.1 MAG: hypothetical protein A2659_00120 [Candidatus Yanofskybacteria bacterium RIFCSPHIGHO2_01_FULL_44_24]OGN15338.1 MAG: hypothetical protein A3B99_02495 [Candidatus Yanofskybacteria bacterium RIFCSPHIGHO2_02_FULL_44_12b]OGN25963.1 MAG: hypothetical protein A2925_04500 [Candidatus Yanofskybacteria bacterium RIFCSPLOWO2_01_FULL_44_22]